MTDHTITFSTTLAPDAGSLPAVFAATCTCGFVAHRNAFKWTVLAVQDHYVEVGLIRSNGEGRGQIVDVIAGESLNRVPTSDTETNPSAGGETGA